MIPIRPNSSVAPFSQFFEKVNLFQKSFKRFFLTFKKIKMFTPTLLAPRILNLATTLIVAFDVHVYFNEFLSNASVFVK